MFHFASEVLNTGVLTGNVVGTSVTPGASGVWGSWTVLVTGANNTRGARWHRTAIQSNNSNGTDRRLLVDLGMRPAGAAGSEITVVPRLVGSKACDANVYNPCGLEYQGPVMIPAGYDVVCRAMSNQASPTAVSVLLSLQADPVGYAPMAVSAEAIGAIDVNVQGTQVAAESNFSGAVSGYGSTWTLVGATTRESRWLDAAVTRYSTSSATTWILAQIAAGDATNKTIVLSDGRFGHAFDMMVQSRGFSRSRAKIPAGTNIYARTISQSAVSEVAVIVYSYY